MPFSSTTIVWREQKQNMPLYGVRCKKCSTIHYPMRRVCNVCSAKDDYEDFKLSRRGKVFTWTGERAVPTADPPMMTVSVDLEGGGRIFVQTTDFDIDKIKIGMDVELTFRVLHESAGFYNYFWKARPAIEKEEVG